MSDISFRPIVIPKAAFDKMMTVPPKLRSDAIALYVFYYYHSIFQRTNQPRCTDTFVAGERNKKWGIGWPTERVARTRILLTELKLIRRVKKTSGKSYIQVIYYQGSESTRMAELEEKLADRDNTIKKLQKQLRQNPRPNSRNSPSRGKEGTNTYSNNKKSIAYSNDTLSPCGDLPCFSVFSNKAAMEFAKVLKVWNPRVKKININEWAKQFDLMVKQDNISKQEIKSTIQWLQTHCQDEYVGLIRHYNPSHLRKKWQQFVDAKVRSLENVDYMSMTDEECDMMERLEHEQDEQREREDLN